MKKRLITLSLSINIALLSFAQPQTDPYRNDFIFGPQIGWNGSKIHDLESTILSEPFFVNYSLEGHLKSGFTVGGFINYRFPDFANLGLQAEFHYSQQANKLFFQNTQTGFNYTIDFKYKYLNTNLLVKGYFGDYEAVLEHLNVGVGLQIGALLNDDIYYESRNGSPAFGSDTEQQQQLRNVIKGKALVRWIGSIGYEFKLGSVPLTLDARYMKSMQGNDAVEVLPNSYNFINNKNESFGWLIAVGFWF